MTSSDGPLSGTGGHVADWRGWGVPVSPVLRITPHALLSWHMVRASLVFKKLQPQAGDDAKKETVRT